MKHENGWTWPELLVLLFVVAVIIALLMPSISHQRQPANLNRSAGQVRGLVQSLVSYAEINRSRYPGIDGTIADRKAYAEVDWDHDGIMDIDGRHVEPRFYELVSRNFFTGELMTSPWETKRIWTTGAVTSNNYSYSLLDIDVNGWRNAEWRNTINHAAVVISDRNTGTAAKPQSIATDQRDQWYWSAAFNDGHVETQRSWLWDTTYGNASFKDDHIFTADSADDAYMIYSGR